MALAVASTSSVASNNADNLTLTKPTGVSSGDLLILIATGFGSGTPPTCTGFTAIVDADVELGSDTLEREHGMRILYRIADSSDESASDYTIGKSGSDTLGVACMLRVTGWTTGNPLYDNAVTEGSTTLSGTYSSGGSSLTVRRPHGQLLIQAHCVCNTDGSTSVFSYDTYSITSSDSNPTWTEVVDLSATVNSGSDVATIHLAVAYAITTDTSDITAYSATLTESTTDNSAGVSSILAVFVEPTSASGTTALHTADPTFFAESAVEVGTVGTHALLTPNVEINDASGKYDTNASSTNIAKNSATPTNQSKTNATLSNLTKNSASVTNIDK